MAGIQWSGGKCHGSGEAKALLRHNDRDQRLQHEHSNPDIDTTLTHLNFSVFNKSYFRKIQAYDQMMDTVKCKRKSSGKNSTVTMQDLVIYCPEGMMDDETGEYDYEQVSAWFRSVARMLKKKYGDCFIDLDVHFDEVHMYVDPQTQKCLWSRVHGHASLIPAIAEVNDDGEPTGEYILNAKNFCTRGAIVDLNSKVHAMTLEQYGMPYMNGSKKKGKASVEDKKRESAKALAELEKQIAEREAELERREREQQELIVLGRRAKAQQLADGLVTNKSDRTITGRKLPNI